ncbi:hypothetical protein [Thiolapillus sp.]|uniref:hypothetical protein n=1 Tax=Thiolapillus sp. TaxID=2017437 RepID=UPI003AF56DBB
MFSLWRKARRENSAASRLLGSTSLRFALHGWQRLNYYSLFGSSIIRNVLFHFDKRLSRWGKSKYKQLKTLMQAARWVNRIRRKKPHGFPHWHVA